MFGHGTRPTESSFQEGTERFYVRGDWVGEVWEVICQFEDWSQFSNVCGAWEFSDGSCQYRVSSKPFWTHNIARVHDFSLHKQELLSLKSIFSRHFHYFPELSPDHTAYGATGAVTGTTGAQHVAQIVESGLHINLGGRWDDINMYSVPCPVLNLSKTYRFPAPEGKEVLERHGLNVSRLISGNVAWRTLTR